MAQLTMLPPEILHNVLSFLSPEDLVVLPRVCQSLHQFVSGNAPLWRDVYCRILDEPPTRSINWEGELKDLVKLQDICGRPRVDKRTQLPFVHDAVTRLLRSSVSASGDSRSIRSVTHPESRNAAVLSELFEDLENRDAFLTRSPLFLRARGDAELLPEPPSQAHQQSAKLHCLYGIPLLHHSRQRASCMYPYACSKVYDLRQHTDRSRWGPFMEDGSDRVDWEKVEALLLVLGHNIQSKNLDALPIFSNFWSQPFAGPWPNSYLTWPREHERMPLDDQDPYGITGSWLRVVCFLDYSEFFAFNFPIGADLPADAPRPPLDTSEATRLILVKLYVTKVEPAGEGDGQELPVVHFRGVSRALDSVLEDDSSSEIKGSVRMTPEGEVRWTTFSIYDGQERWRSEGIQIGGPQSARGVVGNWFDTDYDPHGPCGPTAFWKISDGVPKNENHDLFHDFLPIIDGYEEQLEDGSLEGIGAGMSLLGDIDLLETDSEYAE